MLIASLALATAQPFACTVASVTDGDTVRCLQTGVDGKQVRIRVAGINARERDGSCGKNAPCVDVPPKVATAALQRLSGGQSMRCLPIGTTWGRISAFCTLPSGRDLSCEMLRTGTVARWNQYWRNRPSC